MKPKQIAGLIVAILGIVLLIYGFYGRHRMAKARGDIQETTGFFHEPYIKGTMQGELYKEVDKYKLPVALCFIGGVVLIVGGGILIICLRPKHHHHS